MTSTPMTVYLQYGENPAKARTEVLWTMSLEPGGHMSLLSGLPHAVGYTFVIHDMPFTDGQTIDGDEFCPEIIGTEIDLPRPEAGQLAIALVTALVNNSDQIIGHYIEDRMRLREQLHAAQG